MIDVDAMQGYIRDANPIPTLDDLDPDELTAFVAVAHEEGRAHASPDPTPHVCSTRRLCGPEASQGLGVCRCVHRGGCCCGHRRTRST